MKILTTQIHKAFTLIELLVVIAIIGILASVVVVNVGSSRVKARDAKRMTDISAINTALQLYYDSNGKYPETSLSFPSCGWLTNTPNNHWACTQSDFVPGLIGGSYLSSLPNDPKPYIMDTGENGGGYFYYSDGTDYKLMAHNPENCDYQKNRSIADPARSPGGIYAGPNTTECWSWAYYTPTLKDR